MRPPRIVGLAAWIVLIGGFLALFFFGLQTFRIRLETGDSFPEYSTYRADPKGLKAFYESLQATDLIHVSRRLQSSKILPSGENQVLVVAGIRADQASRFRRGFSVVRSLVGNRWSFDHRSASGKNSTNQNPALPACTTRMTTDNTSFVLWRTLIRRWGAEIAPLSDIHSPRPTQLCSALSLAGSAATSLID